MKLLLDAAKINFFANIFGGDTYFYLLFGRNKSFLFRASEKPVIVTSVLAIFYNLKHKICEDFSMRNG